jgi:hypothetical protein
MEVHRMHNLVILAADGTVAQAKTVLDVRSVAMLLSLFVPVAVSFVAHRTAPPWVKAAFNVFFVAVASAVAFVTDPGNTVLTWQTVVNVFIASLITSLGSLNLLKAFKVTGAINDSAIGSLGVAARPEDSNNPDDSVSPTDEDAITSEEVPRNDNDVTSPPVLTEQQEV